MLTISTPNFPRVLGQPVQSQAEHALVDAVGTVNDMGVIFSKISTRPFLTQRRIRFSMLLPFVGWGTWVLMGAKPPARPLL